jgi:hypothetical protein
VRRCGHKRAWNCAKRSRRRATSYIPDRGESAIVKRIQKTELHTGAVLPSSNKSNAQLIATTFGCARGVVKMNVRRKLIRYCCTIGIVSTTANQRLSASGLFYT